MDSVLLDTSFQAKPPSISPPFASNYEDMLQESIDRLLTEAQKGLCDFSGFQLVSFRLLQSIPDPPLELIWFYSAVSYHEVAPWKKPAINRVLAVRDLLQLLATCSTSSDGLKCIALLAPAVSELYKCVLMEAKEKQKDVELEIESLMEGLLSYISICCSKRSDCAAGLLPCFGDLVRVWTMEQAGEGDNFGVFFPLVSNKVKGLFCSGRCDVGYLAGVVIAEAFLLGLCTKVMATGALRSDLQNDLRTWAVSSVTAFGSCIFFEILLRLLLEPTLPVNPLLNLKDESLVRGILYDAVILVDYSFLYSGTETEKSYACIRCLAFTRLIVTHEAVQIARCNGDLDKAVSYTKAFSSSCIPNELLRMADNRIGMEGLGRPNANTPQAFFRWLLGLEEQGLRLFEDSISKLCSKLIFDESKVVVDNFLIDSDIKKKDGDFFFLEKQGEIAEEGEKDSGVEAMDSEFVAAANSINSASSKGMRKRKGWEDKGGAQVKFVKYMIHNSAMKENFSPSVANSICSCSEVDNLPSDADMKETEP